MVPSVAQLSPMLSGELSALLLEECGADYLSEERMANLVAQIDLAKVGLCTYDRRVNAGYVFFAPANESSSSVAETIAPGVFSLNIDIGHDGKVLGVEILGQEDIFAEMHKVGEI